VANTLLLGLIMASFALIDAHLPYWGLLGWLMLFGAVNSLQFSAMNTLTLLDLTPAHASGGNGLLSVVMQLAMSLGVAIAASLLAIFANASDSSASSEHWLTGFHLTYISLGVTSILAALIFAQLARDEPR
jgi:uncharacterized membrane protein